MTYVLTDSDVGAYIKFEVTPTDDSGLSGDPVSSDASVPILENIVVDDNEVPTVSNLSISGTIESGEEVEALYTFTDVDHDLEGSSAITWEIATTESGSYSAIAGATTNVYLIKSSDEGRYLRFSVVPVAQSGTSPGVKVTSDASGPMTKGNLPPTALNVSISGQLKEEKTLTAVYNYFDREGDAEGISKFQWFSADAADGAFSVLIGETANTMTLANLQVGKFIKVSIVAVDDGGVAGDAVSSTEFGPVVDLSSVSASCSPVILTEASANDGSLDPAVFTVELDGDTFLATDKSNFTLNNLPVGFDFIVVAGSTLAEVNITITGSASAHNASDSINNLSVLVAAAALLSSTTGVTSSPLSISFENPKYVLSVNVNDGTENSQDARAFEEGDAIEIVFTPTNSGEKPLVDLTVDSSDNITFSLTEKGSGKWGCTFIMPAEAVTVTANFYQFYAFDLEIKADAIAAGCSADIQTGTFYDAPYSGYRSDETLEIVITTAGEWKFLEFTGVAGSVNLDVIVYKINLSGDSADAVALFTLLPEKASVIEVSIQKYATPSNIDGELEVSWSGDKKLGSYRVEVKSLSTDNLSVDNAVSPQRITGLGYFSDYYVSVISVNEAGDDVEITIFTSNPVDVKATTATASLFLSETYKEVAPDTYFPVRWSFTDHPVTTSSPLYLILHDKASLLESTDYKAVKMTDQTAFTYEADSNPSNPDTNVYGRETIAVDFGAIDFAAALPLYMTLYYDHNNNNEADLTSPDIGDRYIEEVSYATGSPVRVSISLTLNTSNDLNNRYYEWVSGIEIGWTVDYTINFSKTLATAANVTNPLYYALMVIDSEGMPIPAEPVAWIPHPSAPSGTFNATIENVADGAEVFILVMQDIGGDSMMGPANGDLVWLEDSQAPHVSASDLMATIRNVDTVVVSSDLTGSSAVVLDVDYATPDLIINAPTYTVSVTDTIGGSSSVTGAGEYSAGDAVSVMFTNDAVCTVISTSDVSGNFVASMMPGMIPNTYVFVMPSNAVSLSFEAVGP